MRVLALDGRDARGLFSVLRLLEAELNSSISDAFDWIVGTSAGGIVAVSLRKFSRVKNAERVVLQLLRLLPSRKLQRKLQIPCLRRPDAVFDVTIGFKLGSLLPPRTAVTVHDRVNGTDVALDTNLSDTRNALYGTMMDGTLPLINTFEASHNPDPLAACLAFFGSEPVFVLSIGTCQIKPVDSYHIVRWQISPDHQVSYGSATLNDVAKILNTNS